MGITVPLYWLGRRGVAAVPALQACGYLLGPSLALMAMCAAAATTGGSFCLFEYLTGWPCPACGICHSVRALLGGDWAGACAANPCGPLVLAALLAQMVLALATLMYRMPPVALLRFGLLSGRLVCACLLGFWFTKPLHSLFN